ncbi:hypothetical protein Sme01_10460 [Sphaerisporangium melleum]|uniref:Uncharacterized protein n=1 Tax=Sphaerisporangium melleum TaxID=321316 RepID=A0A917VE41_9ACTN|nr:hypothetical protein [Sphaerisporangium melleum]GGK66690.1 hypothetical protein GCM10007964_07160 [Sphaerisporangium melleum]GII68570.1 hypothetical protein Sme01_10460 [Sphaerisporangium melleum]
MPTQLSSDDVLRPCGKVCFGCHESSEGEPAAPTPLKHGSWRFFVLMIAYEVENDRTHGLSLVRRQLVDQTVQIFVLVRQAHDPEFTQRS